MAKQSEERGKARSLFLTGQYSQKEIAGMCGVSEKSIRLWKEEEQWDAHKLSLLTTRENQLRNLYKILENVNDNTLEDIDAGRRVNPKDADAVIKYTAAIRSLEMETSIADKVEVGTALINLVRREDADAAKVITKWFDIFLQQSIK